MCPVLMRAHCHVWPQVIEFSSVVLSCFMLCCLTVFLDVSPPDVLLNLLIKQGSLIQLIVYGNVVLFM